MAIVSDRIFAGNGFAWHVMSWMDVQGRSNSLTEKHAGLIWDLLSSSQLSNDQILLAHYKCILIVLCKSDDRERAAISH